ncbi:glycine cleavage system aminomethyltransferase GcvT [Candidatus Cyanaurora vandensis]|uniref:glycine cleavage system aminomethyltransferase GcvT n=1 Tax=Candidatus Cyanaurora vandensis TaxID=2714958 RepID=UPI00257DC172|nr:glycine cleavage system aminomethyltransferase GcvT [Candidatus Cyanaurora vandensis]
MLTTPLLPHYPLARLVAFAGWQLPVFYQGVLKEHQAVRGAVGMFDISHMGKFTLTAPLDRLERLVPSQLSKLGPGQAQYTVLLNETGGILDDVIFYRQAEHTWRVIVNASTRARDLAWLQTQLGAIHDESSEQVLLALQGPQAIPLLQTMCDADLSRWGRFGHGEAGVLGGRVWLARTGYTGEDGFEMMAPVDHGLKLWQALLARGVTPCGLGARDSLRLEAALHLYGQDMDQATDPLTAGLGWVVHWTKGDFIGRTALEALKAQGGGRRLVGLQMVGRGIARPGYKISQGGQEVGIITSGGPAPSLNCNIALGYVPIALSSVGTALEVRIRDQAVPALVVKRPFYRRVTN